VSAIDDTLRVELAPFGIRVVEVMPGPVESDMWYASERIAEGVQYEEYRAMAETAYQGRLQVSDQYSTAPAAAAEIRAAILDDDGPMRYGCEPMSIGMIDMWRSSSDEEVFTAITGQG
jgi:NAD(P)-dependent dehydrogenase (short-subunit alcohol dehydrogenase family)